MTKNPAAQMAESLKFINKNLIILADFAWGQKDYPLALKVIGVVQKNTLSIDALKNISAQIITNLNSPSANNQIRIGPAE
jgi:hypothetical protein